MKEFSFSILFVLIIVAIFELMAFAAAQFRPKYFAHSEEILSTYSPQEFEAFVRLRASPELGWRNQQSSFSERENCLGIAQKYTTNDRRNRVHATFDASDAVVLTAGDSFTFGDEVSDHETYTARLQELLGVPVVNLGVGGYGPVQALLRFEEMAGAYPNAKVAVLSIMLDNLYRMVNSFRPAFSYNSSIRYGIKPYMKDGQIIALPQGVFSDLETFRAEARVRLKEDYWSSPEAEFPYLLAWWRAIGSNGFRHDVLKLRAMAEGRGRLHHSLHEPEILAGLEAVISRFRESSARAGLYPVVAFLPRDDQDTETASVIAAWSGERFAGQGLVTTSTDREIDWPRYNLDPVRKCHPSPYGHRAIARNLAQTLEPLLARPQAGARTSN